MKKLCLIVLLLGSFCLAASGAVETWRLKGKGGEKFEAEFIGVEGENAQFKNADGTTRSVPVSSFFPKVQAKLKGGSAEDASGKDDAGSTKGEEVEGDAIGVYETDTFKAVFGKPIVRVYLKDNKGELMPHQGLRLLSYAGWKGKPSSRTFESFREEPVYKDGKVVYKMLRKDEVEMDLYYEAKGNQVKMWYTLRDGDYVSKSQPSVYSHKITFLGDFKYQPNEKKYYSGLYSGGKTLDELRTSYFDTGVNIDYFKGKKVFPYDKTVKKEDKLGALSKGAIVGKMYAPRKISVYGPGKAKGNSWVIFLNYGGQSPFNGYSFILEREDATKLAPNECMTLQID